MIFFKQKQNRLIFTLTAIIVATLTMYFWLSGTASAATISVTPGSGTHTIGSTFDVSIVVDTKGQEINAVQVNLQFPPDKLQLVSPSTGNSIIGIYTTPPQFDNNAGRVQIVGGIPNGINVASGLISKLTFRVKGVGTAGLRFGDSQVLLNDGRGTNVLDNTSGATYKLELPPQQGPIVISETHADQEQWYKQSAVSLSWDVGLPAAEGYSYAISDNPTDIPDDISEGTATRADYKKAPDGINYFHIKSLRDGRWGGVSRYSLKIDTAAPAAFPVVVSPNSRTIIRTPFFQFQTTDTLSGLDRYELKIVPLKIEGRPKASAGEQLFTEASSPFASPELMYGTYSVIVRAYDRAGNIQEVSQRLDITDSILWFVSSEGLAFRFGKVMPWSTVIPLVLLLIVFLTVVGYFVRRRYKAMHRKIVNNHLPGHISVQLAELQKYREKYGKLVTILLLSFVAGITIAGGVRGPDYAKAQDSAFQPPVISSHSGNIKDDELFYVSGRTQEPSTEVILHLQSLVDGNAYDFATTSDNRGDWIYRHNSFLQGGKYILWAHAKSGEQLSAPSPQVAMDVKPVAISWGGSRITYQSLYIGLITVLAVTVLLLLAYILVHALLVRRRRKQFGHQLRQAEDSIKRGFINLRRDIEAELLIIKQANLNAELSGEQKVREEQLKSDLKNIEDLIGKEIWQVETFEKLTA